MQVVIHCIEDVFARIVGKTVRGYLVRRRYRAFRSRFHLVLKKSIKRHRRRMAKRKPKKIMCIYFVAWREFGRRKKQDALRPSVRNLTCRRFRSTFLVSRGLQILELRASRFLFNFAKKSRTFLYTNYSLDVDEYLKFFHVVLNPNMTSTWTMFLNITLPILVKIYNCQIIHRISLIRAKDGDIRLSRAMVVFATLVKIFIRFHARCMHMFRHVIYTFENKDDVSIYMEKFLRHVYHPATGIPDAHIKHQWYQQTDALVPMFAVELDFQEQCKDITETWFSSPRKFGDDIFWIFDDLRFAT